MGTFKEDLEYDMVTTFFDEDEFAFEVLYNGMPVLAIDDGQRFQNTGAPGLEIQTRSLMIQQAEVEQPRPGDKVEIGAATWYVGPDPALSADIWTISIQPEILQAAV